jgi:MFS family permease
VVSAWWPETGTAGSLVPETEAAQLRLAETLAATAWAASWAVVIAGGRLGGGAAAAGVFVIAMVIFAVGETLFSPTMPAIINDLAPPEAAGRYNGLGVLAFTTGFLIGPAAGSAALGAWGTGLFAALIVVCLFAAVAALRLSRHLPPGVNQIESPAAETTDELVYSGEYGGLPEDPSARPG